MYSKLKSLIHTTFTRSSDKFTKYNGHIVPWPLGNTRKIIAFNPYIQHGTVNIRYIKQ